MYNVPAYGKMIADAPRFDAYVAALRHAIKPDSVVVDLGSGPGIFALIACRLGARRVFAIEPADIIQVGRDAARELGFTDRIEFIQSLSTRVTLPERADVIVFDLRGVLPWLRQSIASIIDARSRFLAPGGIMVPSLDRLWAAVVETPEHYKNLVSPWEANGNGIVLKSARNCAVNIWSKTRVQPENFLSQPVCWHELDYHQVEDTSVRENMSFTIVRNGTAHGLAVWFDTELLGDAGFSNAPGSAELIYGNAFFPFKQPLEVSTKDRIDVRVEARPTGDDYAWRWDTTHSSKGKRTCSFTQSTLLGAPLSASKLRKRAGSYAPEANEEGAITRFVLSQMDGRNSNERIAAELLERFSHRFRDREDALDVVFEVSDKYGV